MSSPLAHFAPPPFQTIAVFAFVLGTLGVFFAWLSRREREPGMEWFAPGFLFIAVFAVGTPYQGQGGATASFTPWAFAACAGLVCLSFGLVAYLNVPAGWRRRALWAMLLPALIFTGLFVVIGLSDAKIPRSLSNLPVGAWFLGAGALAWWAGSREEGAGHRLLATLLLSVPLLAIAMASARFDAPILRYYAFLPVTTLGLTLLTTSLLRRRRTLEAEVQHRSAAETKLAGLNAQLEEKVAERMADLQNLVVGLQSFNRSVSHDLRGSLGGIGALARLAHESLVKGDETLAWRALPMIADQAESSTQLTNALLSLAKVSDVTLQRQTVDLHQLVSQVVERLTWEHGESPMPRIEVAPDMPSINADIELLKPVLNNLIGNAIKFTREAPDGHIQIGASQTAAGVTVSVRDNGVGFDVAAAGQLFTPFVRLHQAKFDGHGVGLSIVRRAVERHGGRVWAESQPGRGAVFRFSLPA
jgi:signal transduction histidine kinase